MDLCIVLLLNISYSNALVKHYHLNIHVTPAEGLLHPMQQKVRHLRHVLLLAADLCVCRHHYCSFREELNTFTLPVKAEMFGSITVGSYSVSQH